MTWGIWDPFGGYMRPLRPFTRDHRQHDWSSEPEKVKATETCACGASTTVEAFSTTGLNGLLQQWRDLHPCPKRFPTEVQP